MKINQPTTSHRQMKTAIKTATKKTNQCYNSGQTDKS